MDKEVLKKIGFLVGDTDVLEAMSGVAAKEPFDDDMLSFLSEVSKCIQTDKRSRQYSDVVTFAFWIRKASLSQMKGKYGFKEGIHLGRGIAFHIAPSNVPVNFAYSLVSGLLTGNANIVRVPRKEFQQVEIIADAFNKALDSYAAWKPYIVLVRYERDKDVNDALSAIADTRIIWGGDNTIAQIRNSPLPPRSTEITFADRYSLAVIDSDAYMKIVDKDKVAQDFYNDTYFSDQNACTSPRVVIWIGNRKEEAKEVFWGKLYSVVKSRYAHQEIQGVNKLTSAYKAASARVAWSNDEQDTNVGDGAPGRTQTGDYGVRILPHSDNLLIRICVNQIDAHLMDYMDNSGYFYEHDCDNVMELFDICNDKRCQTAGMIGDKTWLMPLIKRGVKGIDRIVDIGKTMDFELVWDGYDLPMLLTRRVCGLLNDELTIRGGNGADLN